MFEFPSYTEFKKWSSAEDEGKIPSLEEIERQTRELLDMEVERMRAQHRIVMRKALYGGPRSAGPLSHNAAAGVARPRAGSVLVIFEWCTLKNIAIKAMVHKGFMWSSRPVLYA